MNFAYARPRDFFTQHSDIKRQFEACETLARLHGLPLKQDEGGGGLFEAQSVSDEHILQSLTKRMGPGDVLLISSPDVLSSSPSKLIEIASKLVGQGVKVLVASSMGELSLPDLRTYAAAFIGLEQTVAELEARLKKQAADFDAELADFMKTYDAKILAALSQKGISISQLAGAGNVKEDIGSPSRARELRELRQGLGMSQEIAGALLKTYFDQAPLTKAAISKLETNGTGTHYVEYLAALQAETYAQNKAAKAAMQTAPAFDYHTLRAVGLPTPGEEATAQEQANEELNAH